MSGSDPSSIRLMKCLTEVKQGRTSPPLSLGLPRSGVPKGEPGGQICPAKRFDLASVCHVFQLKYTD